MSALMPFTVRVEDGRETSHYTTSAAQAAVTAEHRCGSPAVLVIRADEHFSTTPARAVAPLVGGAVVATGMALLEASQAANKRAERMAACERFTNDLLVEFGYDLKDAIDLDAFRDWILDLRAFAGEKTCAEFAALRKAAR